ncbi:MAG: hypothetical protein A3B11_01840 [Candidatus Taylorbacteria bacterium RIFCSPLOWO2_01_FULL_44_26]|uniref:SMC-Scp complex subunit ScpB n=2 Tax=Candidatus Tayloriibacteriota TaxID=1817919 RepID=A0A1G2MJ61_9BACT|nr:MAG: hypothetical protein A3D50_02055 [Candidatus Taylorbacteria bacterium RIFCSPHIGHO2_02_FULL_44_12]OHA31415.1 MAG: hypothetical protein A3B11_01840 [Candidatus Taylorbacteria bacterium RIFCSPLOWO2_01_FULL_44_26]
MEISQKIEAILFWKGEPMTIKKLTQLIDTDESSIQAGITNLAENLKGRGLTLVENADSVSLGTTKELSGLIEKLNKDDLSGDLGKAGLETISIVLYCGPISRADIDHIRGVNSSFILRALLVRGLIERLENQLTSNRGFVYQPTIALLSHLGISKLNQLPDYPSIRSEIEIFLKGSIEKESSHE